VYFVALFILTLRFLYKKYFLCWVASCGNSSVRWWPWAMVMRRQWQLLFDC
jgi:hypothetical protein